MPVPGCRGCPLVTAIVEATSTNTFVDLVLECPQRSVISEIALADPVDLYGSGAARCLHALDVRRPRRLCLLRLRVLRDTAALYLKRQQRLFLKKRVFRTQARDTPNPSLQTLQRSLHRSCFHLSKRLNQWHISNAGWSQYSMYAAEKTRRVGRALDDFLLRTKISEGFDVLWSKQCTGTPSRGTE